MRQLRTTIAIGSGMLLLGGATVFALAMLLQDSAPAKNPDASIRGVSDDHGSIRSIRGIEGIDTVTLENLEVVLRMQDRPQENQGKGTARNAAKLLSTELPEELEEIPDARDVHEEFELEGS